MLRTAENERTVSYEDGTNTRRTYKYRLMGETSSEIPGSSKLDQTMTFTPSPSFRSCVLRRTRAT